MNYLELLGLTREPFSNSPDPDAFYSAPEHGLCLNLLEIAIQLRRGLNVVYGEVGTGKSTLCRRLLRSLDAQTDMEAFLLLDAGGSDERAFMAQLYELFSGKPAPAGLDRRQSMSLLQEVIYAKALEQKHNLALLIDEGQKLTPTTLEVLRELLNFETNTEKLLQIVIFAQPELRALIDTLPNLKDRINEAVTLTPLPLRESMALLRFRMNLSGGQAAERLFTDSGLAAIHKAGQGRPRQMIRLGHQMLLALIMGNKSRVTAAMVRAQVARDNPERPWRKKLRLGFAAGALVMLVAGTAIWLNPQSWGTLWTKAAPVTDAAPAANAQPAPRPAAAGPLAPAPAEQPAASRPNAGAAPSTPTPADTAAEKRGSLASIVPGANTPHALPAQPAPLSGATTPAPAAAQTAPLPELIEVEGVPYPALAARHSPANLGVVRAGRGDTLIGLAKQFYGAGNMAPRLAEANPRYVEGEAYALTLPALRFAVLPKLRTERLISYGEYATAQEARQACRAHGAEKLWRIAARELAPGEPRFYLLSIRSFPTVDAARRWLAANPAPRGVTPALLPPYRDNEPCWYGFTR